MINFILMAVLILSSCSSRQPDANLKFEKLYRNDQNIELEFSSNVNLRRLFSENQTRRQVSSELICSLTDDKKLQFDHKMDYFANARLKNIVQAGGSGYHFKAQLMFWHAPKDASGSDIMLTEEQVAQLIERKKSILCLYRATVYMAGPYYSNTMNIPSHELLGVIQAAKSTY